ncbi:hypothetical protein IQ07DRAFT_649735 [Pyrenochaeta sp. DS3sAY3a]|nr:hypothetical protein IQ07DRAFT_649735 [Pyrenochaeta sp. DS3sAY3a]
MKFVTIIAILSASVAAQTACDSVAASVPTCGVPCIQTAASSAGCGSGDYRCRCSNSAIIQSSAQACVISNCGIVTALQVQASGSAVCACAATATAAP